MHSRHPHRHCRSSRQCTYFFLMTTTLPLLPTVTCTSSSTSMKSLKPFALVGKFICATPSWPCTHKVAFRTEQSCNMFNSRKGMVPDQFSREAASHPVIVSH